VISYQIFQKKGGFQGGRTPLPFGYAHVKQWQASSHGGGVEYADNPLLQCKFTSTSRVSRKKVPPPKKKIHLRFLFYKTPEGEEK